MQLLDQIIQRKSWGAKKCLAVDQVREITEKVIAPLIERIGFLTGEKIYIDGEQARNL